MTLKIFLIKIFILHSLRKTSELECADTCVDKHSSSLNCYCDQCDLFDDCCQNRASSIKQSLYECNAKLYFNKFIYTIGLCPKNFTNEIIRQKCESSIRLIEKTPVFSNETSDFYKNIFCAKCNLHDKSLNKLSIFSVIVLTSSALMRGLGTKTVYENSTIENILNGTSSYFLKFKEPNHTKKPRSCIKSINTCPTNYSNQTVNELCKNYTAYRYRFGKIYKNEHCALCNGDLVVNCGLLYINKAYIQSLQILFDLSELNDQIYLTTNVSNWLNKNKIFTQKESIEEFRENDNFYCFPFDQNMNKKADLAKKYATLVGHVISMLSLLLLLVCYARNKDLRNLPGKILMNLSISLLLSQLLFIISTYYTNSLVDIIFDSMENKCQVPKLRNQFDELKSLLTHIKLIIPCFLSGLLTHYFYLVFFLWSNIMAFDLFQMFTKSGQSAPKYLNNDSKLFLKYFLMAWFLPLILIIILLLKNYKKLSYGFDKCFISSNLDLLIFFVVPIVIVLSMNIVYLSVSIKAIAGVDLLKKKYIKNPVPTISFSGLKSSQEQHSLKRRLILFLKLFVLTGMTWIIGIISALINDKNSFLWYVYIVLNSLQGLFIFCSYSFNQNSKTNIVANFLLIFTCFKAKKTFTLNSTSSQKQST